MSEATEVEKLRKKVEALEAEIADVKARCVLKEVIPEEVEEAESEAESTTGEAEATASHTEQ